MNKIIITIFTLLFQLDLWCQVNTETMRLDVTSYKLTIEPDLNEKSLSGSVTINFQVNMNSDSVIFNSGNLQIDTVTGNHVIGFKKINTHLIVYLSARDSLKNQLVIDYHGKPKKGLIFEPENEQAYTMYFTSDWMICNDSPEDKALFNLKITIPDDKTCIASGELINKIQMDNKVVYSYCQNTETPSYTYGFAIGKYTGTEQNYDEVLLKYYALNYSPEQINIIFKETPAMIAFFEEKSGIKYFQSTYSQVLGGKYFQEMSGFSMLKDNYGEMVLRDSTETNLISHEMAHQWWGNRITCKSWNHFWLNEGMATFLSAAYNEYRFGKNVYLANIESYKKVYEEINSRGNDKSLVFDDWSNASKDDRNLVYFKGAYVMHLLKEKLGDEVFWKAIRFYSTKFNGKSVETADFQKAFEESSGIVLGDFFDTWVYKRELIQH